MSRNKQLIHDIVNHGGKYQLISRSKWSTVYMTTYDGKKYILKHAQGPASHDIITNEHDGLLRFREFGLAPNVLGCEQLEDRSYLLMDFVESGKKTELSQEKFGHRLAKMHQHKQAYFGLDHNNFIAGIAQDNTAQSDWALFFVTQRLLPLYKSAYDNGQISDIPAPEKMIDRLRSLLPNDISPALLHGDLWSGNYITDPQENTYLIDPAISYGHDFVDIAMTRLFGGFSKRFYDAYHEVIATPQYQQELLDLYQLYFLLIHLRLFGSSYHASVAAITHRYFGSQ